MKKIISLLMLVTGITGSAIAQEETRLTSADRNFNFPSDYLKRSFTVDLGKGNKMQVSLSHIEDLSRFANIDSLLRIFLEDIALLKDSLSEELLSKRIDYHTDELGRKKIRLQHFIPVGSNFLMQQGELVSLKLTQDTVNFIGSYEGIVRSTLLRPYSEMHYYQLSFFVNKLADLNNYINTGLNEKISTIHKNEKGRWINDGSGQWHIKNGDKSIYSNHQPAGYVSGTGDYLTSRVSVNFQNYKNYFVPSFSAGAALIFSNGRIKRDLGLLWEPHFFFAKNTQGNMQTYRNDFLTFTFGQSYIRKNKPVKAFSFINEFSFGYLIRRSGNYFEKNTMRIGIGQLSLFNEKIKIEPIIYFNNLFKGVTPGLKLSVNF